MRKNIFVILGFILCSSATIEAQHYLGNWYGALELGTTRLKLDFTITLEEGVLKTTMDSPDQGVHDIVIEETAFTGDTLTLKSTTLNMVFKGYVAPAGNRISGIFSQNNYDFKLVLTRTREESTSNRRPQDPVDFNYYVENVRFVNRKDTVALAGTLTTPFDGDISHTVILITGSGPQNRNHELPGVNHRPFLVLSDFLTQKGIAVLRYDDRGVAQSTGNFMTATSEDFANDARAAIEFVRSRPDLEGSKIGLIGHSEGGMIASMIGNDVDFLVLLGTPGTNIPQLLLSQSRLLSEVQGVEDSIITASENMLAMVYTYLATTEDEGEELTNTLKSVFIEGLSYYPEEITNQIDANQFAEMQMESVLTPWFRYFLRFSTYDYLSKVVKPVLAITGTLDLQVPYGDNLAAIEYALQEAGNQNFEVYAYEGVNHLFQTAFSGSNTEYGLLTETFNPGVMEEIATWILSLK